MRALKDKEKGLGMFNVDIAEDAVDYLVEISEGDGRIALNSLELGVLTTPKDDKGIINIDLEVIKDCIQVKQAKYDKGGDEHYDTISAFIKSMRGLTQMLPFIGLPR